jgi:hypothetical protein
MSEEKIKLSDLKTGDLLLFESTSGFWFSNLINYFTNSVYSHAALVLQEPTYINPLLTKTYALESGFEKFDAENNRKKDGVQIIDLAEKIDSYTGHIWVRRLRHVESQDKIIESIKEMHKTFHDHHYDLNPLDPFMAAFQIKGGDDQRTNTFFCSALVCYIYCKLGLLPTEEDWDLDTPAFLAGEDVNQKFIGASLGDLIELK